VIIVTATDTVGNTSTDTITITRDAAGPTVTITSPTSAANHTVTTTTVSLAGTASDSSLVTGLTWSNVTTGASGSATGTNSWSIASITLGAGKNTIVVTGFDTFGNSATDSIEVYGCNATTFPGAAGFVVGADGHCFVKSPTPTSRAMAQSTCTSLGGALATITDATENVNVASLGTTDRWIGLNDLTTEGTFQWPTGEGVSYTNWPVGEPANTGANDCVKMVSSGTWAVTTCAASLPAVCEIAP
jgi:hypothetical protein